LYRVITDFKNGYQLRTNIVKDEKDDLVTDSHSILVRWRDHFSQLFNVYGVSDIRQTDYINTAEPLMPEPSASDFVMVIKKLNRHTSPSIYQIRAELIKAGVGQIHKHINST